MSYLDREDMKWGDKVRAPWYFKGWFEKILLLIQAVALVYAVVRIAVQGWW